MALVTFVDDNPPYLNAQNLNNNFNEFVPVVLYNNTSGTDGTIALSDSSANYTYLEIFFMTNSNNDYSSVKVFQPNGKRVRLQIININPTLATPTMAIRSVGKDISGSSITNGQIGYSEIKTNNTITMNDTNGIKVVRVIGYK